MTAITWLHPAVLLLAAAALVGWVPAAARRGLAVAVPLAALLLVLQLPDGVLGQWRYLDWTLQPLKADALGRLFAAGICAVAALGAVYGLRQDSRVEPAAVLLYAGSAVGVSLAGDLLSLFIWWELMAIGSTLVIWCAGTRESWAAAQRYLLVHLLGGVLLLAGIAAHAVHTGSLAVSGLYAAASPTASLSAGTLLILAGFLVNAAAWPLASWVADAYPRASVPGAVFLSAFTTKTAVLVLMRGFAGLEALVVIGLVMALYGLVWGLREDNMRRMLAYGLVNQNGLMLVGVGIGTPLALNGVALQAVMGMAYMGLLMMVAGAVMQATGHERFSQLTRAGHLRQAMPWTAALCMVGAAAVAAVPLTGGFVAKSMVSAAAGGGWLAACLMLASVTITLHAGLRMPWLLFLRRADDAPRDTPRDTQRDTPAVTEAPAHMRWAMAIMAVLCLVPGFWPQSVSALLPHELNHAAYTFMGLVKQFALLGLGVLLYLALRQVLQRHTGSTPDVDLLWRKPGLALAGFVALLLHLGREMAAAAWQAGAGCASRWLERHLGPQAALSRTWAVRSMALWVMLMMLGYLLLYYL